jgi:hypothetical protein
MINPAKSEIGIIRKHILDRINTEVRPKININQWKNTKAVLEWFANIQYNPNHSFIIFDIVEFYPSISSDTLTAALNFAGRYTNISENDREVILHAKDPSCSQMENAGVKNLQTNCLTSRWDHTMEQKRASLLVCISYMKSKKQVRST